MKTALITGGFGFVGRRFVSELLNLGYSVHVVDNQIPGGGSLFPSSEWVGGDPRIHSTFSYEVEDCRTFFVSNRTTFDLVIHLAAVVGGRLTIELNPMAVAEDLSIDADFWKWAGVTKPKQIVHFSSSAAYPTSLQGPSSYRPLAESDIQFADFVGVPDLTYGWAKLSSEYLGLFAARQFGLNVLNFRPFSGYGEDQDDSYPFPAIAKRALLARESDTATFMVWGSGLQERDFIHISDVVSLVMSGVGKELSGYETFNLGTGIATNFKSLARLALGLCDLDIEVSAQTEMPEGVFSRVANIEKQQLVLGAPTIDLATGMEMSIEYLSHRL